MEPSDICSINAPEPVITEAIDATRKAVAALDSLLLNPWTKQMIDRKATAAAWQLNLDKQELAEFLIEKIRSEIHTISNPNNRPVSSSLEAWSTKVVENHGKNILKHEKVVKKHESLIEHIHTVGKRNSIPIQKSSVPTPEEELIEKEEQPIWDSRKLEMRDKVRKVITEDVIIAYRWGIGQKPEQIARDLNIPVKTIYRRLSHMQKAVIEKIGIEENDENKAMVRAGLRQSFANSLRPVIESTAENVSGAKSSITAGSRQR